MITRRVVILASAALALAGCSSVDSSIANVQRRYAAQQGVAAVILTAYIPNESIWDKAYEGKITFTADATVERQGTLIALLFDYLRDAGLDPLWMHGMTFTTAQGVSVSFGEAVHDANLATEVAAVVASTPGASLSIDYLGPPLPVLNIDWKVSTEEAKDLVHSVARISAVIKNPSLDIGAGVNDCCDINGFDVSADRPITTQELAFAAALQAWMPTHGVVGLVLPFNERDDWITIHTIENQTADLRVLIQWARSVGIKNRVDAYLEHAATPYLTIPRA